MGLFDGLAGDVLDPFSNLTDAFSLLGGSDSTNASGGLNFGLPVSFAPAYSPPPNIMTSVPMAVPTSGASGSFGSLVPRWSMSFPNLWQAIQKLIGNYGKGWTPDKLYGLVRKFGPAWLASVIGSAAVSELLLYKSKKRRRRMNPANAKALRRSMRRLKSFESLSHRVSMQLSRSAHRRSYRRSGARATYEQISVKNR